MTGRGLTRTIAVVVVTLAALAWTVPAQAHTELAGTSPTPGSAVSLNTTRLLLEFDDLVLPAATEVVVRGPDGGDLPAPRPEVLGAQVAVPVHLTSAGRYDVAYRVIGRDGHLVTGSFWFTAAADAGPPSAAVAFPRAGPEPDTTTTGAPTLASHLWWLPVGGLCLVLTVLRITARRQQRRRAAA